MGAEEDVAIRRVTVQSVGTVFGWGNLLDWGALLVWTIERRARDTNNVLVRSLQTVFDTIPTWSSSPSYCEAHQ